MALWVRPICDQLLAQVKSWDAWWPHGKVAATRPFLEVTGEVSERVTKRALDVAWIPKQFEMLVKILKDVRPTWEFTVQLDEFYRLAFPKTRMLPNGQRLTTMAVNHQDVKDLVQILEEVRTGRKSAAKEMEKGTFWDSV